MSPKTSFIIDDVLCHATTSAAAMFGSCTTVFGAWLVSQARVWPRRLECDLALLSMCTRAPHLAPIFPGHAREELPRCNCSCVCCPLCCALAIANSCSTQVSVLTKQLCFLSEEDASNCEEDIDGSVPLDYIYILYNQTDGSKALQAPLSCNAKRKADIPRKQ